MPDLVARVKRWTFANASRMARRASATPLLGVLAVVLVLAGEPAASAAQVARHVVWDSVDVSVELRSVTPRGCRACAVASGR